MSYQGVRICYTRTNHRIYDVLRNLYPIIIMVSAAFSNRSLSLPLLNHFIRLTFAVAQNKCHLRRNFSFQSLLRVEQLQLNLGLSCWTKNNQKAQISAVSLPYFTCHNKGIATNSHVAQKPCFQVNYSSTNTSGGKNYSETDAVDHRKKNFIYCKLSIADQPIIGKLLDVAVQPGDSVGIIKRIIKKQCTPLLDDFSELEMDLYATAESTKFMDVDTKWNTDVNWGKKQSPLLVKANKIDLKLKGKRFSLLYPNE
jgi:hypothetical protein